jgi:N6-L-threonylcarbamoyladenine synthase
MLNSQDYDFSFSGLKTAVRYSIQNHGELSDDDKRALARDFEDAVVEVLVSKTLKALAQYGAQTLIIGGGVIANTTLREAFSSTLAEKFPDVSFLLPNRNLSTDNATMIAMASYLHLAQNEALKPEQVLESDQLIANGNLALK